MKKIFIIIGITVISLNIFAQSPQKMSYQMVIRNSSGHLVANHTVGIRISIVQGSPAGTIVYQETYNPNPQTNENGLVSIEIGGGIPEIGVFSSIYWASGIYFLKTETDPSGGTNYTITGTSQLLSVPYAIHAKTAENGFSGNYNDLSDKPILFDGSWTNVTGKPTTVSGYGITDAVTTSGDQTISGKKTFSGTTSVSTPVNSNDAVNKAYVDELKAQIKALEDNLIATGTYKMIDIDGNEYRVVKIENQVWAAENLKTSKYNDGSPIPNVTDNVEWGNLVKEVTIFDQNGPINWEIEMSGAFCWYNNDSATYENDYGKLYNFGAVATGKICPTGWHVPTGEELWSIFYGPDIGNGFYRGADVMETGTTHWKEPLGTNETGFTALPGGSREGGIGERGDIWSSSGPYYSALGWHAGYCPIPLPPIYLGTTGLTLVDAGLSIRCLKD